MTSLAPGTVRSVVNGLHEADRQAAGRAFAAEFLAPIDEVLSMKESGADIAAIADELKRVHGGRGTTARVSELHPIGRWIAFRNAEQRQFRVVRGRSPSRAVSPSSWINRPGDEVMMVFKAV